MKRKILIAIPVFIVVILLTRYILSETCNVSNNSGVESNFSNGSNDSNDRYSDITIHSPMTLSNNDMYSINGEHQYLRLQMIKGKYYEEWNPGPYMGTIWEGDFIIELIDDSGELISQIDLSKVYKGKLIFTSSFQIEFDDYNKDGDLDFTIGQYASSNGREYTLFTLRKDGKIELLPINGYSSLFISKTTGYYSTKLTKKTDTSFTIEYYDNSVAKNIQNEFEWDGKEFIKNWDEVI